MVAIVKKTPTDLNRRFDLPMRRLFEDMFDTFGTEFGVPELFHELHAGWPEETRAGWFAPTVDVAETGDTVTLTAEVPGMTKDDLEVSIEEGFLLLKGEKKEVETKEGEQFHRSERRYGRFERRIRLPEHLDTEHIEASYSQGVLTLRIPKTGEAKAKRVEIK